MKIIFNNTIFFNQKIGGISRYITCLAENLFKRKIDIKIIAPIYKNQYLNKIPRELISGIFIKKFPNLKIIEMFNNFLFKKNIFYKNSEIIHDTYYSESLLDIKNKKKVLTIYDMIHEKFPNMYGKNLISYRKKIISQSDFFICISKKTQEDFLNFYNVNKEKTKVIYLGSEHIIKESNIINFNIGFKKPFILYVGSRRKYKNFITLFNSYCYSKKLKNDFNMVCFGGGAFSKDELINFEKNNLRFNLFHLEGDDDILKQLYIKASVLVFPSIYEGFGLPLVESMKIGCPVIASNIEVIKEICGQGVKYFDYNSFEGLKTVLEETLYSESKLKILKKKGYEIAEDFKWSKCADETLKVYKSI
jgi:glycosyltransferase involved in cell wall biosynthesis